jgi:hypothetical protein
LGLLFFLMRRVQMGACCRLLTYHQPSQAFTHSQAGMHHTSWLSTRAANVLFCYWVQGADGGLPQAADLAAARSQQRSGNAIPVLAAAGAGCSEASLQQQLPSLAAPADGFCMPLQLLQPAAAAADPAAASTSSGDSAAVSAAVGVLLQALTEGHTPEAAAVGDSSSADWSSSSSSGGDSGAAGSAAAAAVSGGATTVKVPSGGSALRRLLNASKESLIAEERKLLQQVAQLLEEVAPQVRCAT